MLSTTRLHLAAGLVVLALASAGCSDLTQPREIVIMAEPAPPPPRPADAVPAAVPGMPPPPAGAPGTG